MSHLAVRDELKFIDVNKWYIFDLENRLMNLTLNTFTSDKGNVKIYVFTTETALLLLFIFVVFLFVCLLVST